MLRELADVHGPFISVHLPPFARLPAGVLDHPVTAGPAGRSLIVAEGRVLVDEEPAWPPPSPVVRTSDLPYLLPLATRLDDSEIAVEGLPQCAAALTAGQAEALVICPDVLADQEVWVGGTHRDEVGPDPATPRAAGLPPNRQRADEALPMAALATGAEVYVAENLPLKDGVGVRPRTRA